MKILQKFGFDIRIFIFQLINFLVIAFIIKKFLYKPLHKILYERKLKIKKSIMYTKNIKLIMNNINKEKYKIIHNAQQDANKLLVETKQYIENLKQETLLDINKQAKQIFDTAINTSKEECRNMKRDMEHLSLNVAEIIIKKVLYDIFSKTEQNQLVVRALKQINMKYNEHKTN
jgi:F-type H+-transporting ATPase subunit b